jgi:SAM-dependent methyltransferase
MNQLTDNDRERSATASGVESLLRSVEGIPDGMCNALLDVGCGYGGLARIVGDRLGAREVHGVDIDQQVIGEAREKGVAARCVDVEHERLPYDSDSFDVVLSLGMLDYLPTFDGVLSEIRRVLRPNGYVLLSLPNLASWNNRLALLLGYQPRDVEISERSIVGALPHYRNDVPAGHLHTATLRAFRDLMVVHGFLEREVVGGSWLTRNVSTPLALIDRLFSRRPSLSRRFFYLGQKDATATVDERSTGWWSGRDAVQQLRQ